MRSRVLPAVLAAAVVAVVPAADRAAAGCSPNLAWQDRFPQWSPRGDRFLFLRELVDCGPAPNELVLATPDGRVTKRLANAWAPSWSPDGRFVAYVGGHTLRIEQAVGTGSDELGLADRSWLVWGAPGIAFFRDRTLWLADPRTLAARPLVSDTRLRGPIAWTPTNEVVAVRVAEPRDDETMQLVLVRLDGTVVELTPPGGRYGRATVSGASGKVVVAHRPRGVVDWQLDELDPRTGTRRILLDDPEDEVEPSFDPQGSRLAYVRRHKIDEGILALAPPAIGVRELGHDAHPFSPPSWRPGGFELLYAAGHECLRWGIYRTGPAKRLTNRCRFDGTPRRDTLRGTPFLDFLFGRGGDDVLHGGRGRDSLLGGSGADRLLGGDGDDWIQAGTGRDSVLAGRGNDDVRAVDGSRDVVSCGAGRHDLAYADRRDAVSRDCERIIRV